ncbi:shikimate dehydrogenase [Candidatus Falkowbacteria bacterium]|uniref:Shikimate dehydrogenase (NADP(+)) n=1 Tax=Candidatus Buchananbacteria bacterium CG10_big_fil_rev_8_21_14_0_10_33_19 TaxID=1974525 RepID=A0A2H0W3A8_9BACT|nr:shikimate dehydrogenase [Candidatus Falkowbacteria bacterium]PIS05838.1 MAG: shikimate dehydrogenase [Candidatus Buchananbacteria bacterium CG10_big_fil_rev_8_21_14_0_10_33_19]
MKIDKDTIACISMASRPGDLGATIFNASFDHLSLNYIYKPFGVTLKNLDKGVNGIRAFGIRGCGVSMPHKVEVMKYLDEIDDVAKKIGAINTIVNNDGKLTGYNTDFFGAKKIISETYNLSGKKVLIIGAGGVSRAIIMALKENGAGEIFIANRNESKAETLATEFELTTLPYDKINDFSADLLVNATAVGMSPDVDEMIILESAIDNFEAVMDVVIYPSVTKLMALAQNKGKVVIAGFNMALYQAAEQFKMYTGVEAPLGVMKENMINLFSQK